VNSTLRNATGVLCSQSPQELSLLVAGVKQLMMDDDGNGVRQKRNVCFICYVLIRIAVLEIYRPIKMWPYQLLGFAFS